MVQTKTHAAAAALLVALALGCAARAETAIPAAPERWFTDKAGFVSPATRARLDQQLGAYARASGHQVIVYVDRTTGGVPVEEWAVRAFEAWGVGGKGKDDGLALFIFSEDRKARVEVGYGLEDRVTDLQANRILQERLLPGIRAGETDAAVTSTVGALLSTIEGKPVSGLGSERSAPGQPRPLSGGQLVLMLLVGVGLLILFITNPSLALFLLFQLASGGRGEGHRGGGGGFSGGGGRSGGGGATGSW